MNKPYSPACDNNRDPILSVIKPLLADKSTVLEVGSGTGQHAVYFGQYLPHLDWHTSDTADNHPGIRAWVNEAGLANVYLPVTLDVCNDPWPEPGFDAVFSANTTHIMNWPEVEALFAGTGRLLQPGGLLILYGPFNFGNRYTSDSNRSFDEMLRTRDPHSGIRNFEDLDALASNAGLEFRDSYAMPANNHILLWGKASDHYGPGSGRMRRRT